MKLYYHYSIKWIEGPIKGMVKLLAKCIKSNFYWLLPCIIFILATAIFCIWCKWQKYLPVPAIFFPFVGVVAGFVAWSMKQIYDANARGYESVVKSFNNAVEYLRKGPPDIDNYYFAVENIKAAIKEAERLSVPSYKDKYKHIKSEAVRKIKSIIEGIRDLRAFFACDYDDDESLEVIYRRSRPMSSQSTEFCIAKKICVAVSVEDLRYLCDFCNLEFPGRTEIANMIAAHQYIRLCEKVADPKYKFKAAAVTVKLPKLRLY